MLPSEFFVLSWLPVGCRSLWQIPTPYQPSMPPPPMATFPTASWWGPGGLASGHHYRRQKMIAISTRCASHLWVSKVRHVPCTPLILTAGWEVDKYIATTYMRRFAQGTTCSHKHSQDTYRMQALQVRCDHEKQSLELPGMCPEHKLPCKLAGCLPCCDW